MGDPMYKQILLNKLKIAQLSASNAKMERELEARKARL